jgi:hypothetical protein
MKRAAIDEGAAGDSGVNGPRFLLALSLFGVILLPWGPCGSSIASAQSSAQTNSPTESSGEPQKVDVPISGRGLPEFPEAFSRGIVLPHPRSAIHQSGGKVFDGPRTIRASTGEGIGPHANTTWPSFIIRYATSRQQIASGTLAIGGGATSSGGGVRIEQGTPSQGGGGGPTF